MDGSALFLEAGSRSAFKSNSLKQKPERLKMEGPWTLTMEACRLIIEPWRESLKTSGRRFPSFDVDQYPGGPH